MRENRMPIFQTLVDYFGLYAVVEMALLLLVILLTLAVYKFTKELHYKPPSVHSAHGEERNIQTQVGGV